MALSSSTERQTFQVESSQFINNTAEVAGAINVIIHNTEIQN